ncbi:metallophosphoesterase [Rheinheimera sp. WS51]|uniref:metallophosphoesterase n=1 Tax=Rheinheimera sp. WS51 TaxID=3425886 RepID=UPI003D8F041D
MPYIFPSQHQYRLVQISDCHLLASPDDYYQGIQPAKHLQAIVDELTLAEPDGIILTGDLVQQASALAYQLLADIMAPLSCPIFCLPGNHDDLAQLALLTQQPPFQPAMNLNLNNWQLLLLNTKGPTPSGVFPQAQQQWLQQQLRQSEASDCWLFCHHHPRPLGHSIDTHGQEDADILWQHIAAEPRIRGIAHGHSHYAYSARFGMVNIVGCPASSVQFLPTLEWQTNDQGPQWCEWIFSTDHAVQWQFKTLSRKGNE